MNNHDWQEVELGKIAEYVTVGYVGPMVQEYLPSGIPFLRSQNIEPYRLDLNDITYISEIFHEKIKKSSLQPGDVVIVRTGRPGASAVIPDTLPISNCSDMVVVRPGSKLDARYLCYYINSVAQEHVSAYSVGAVQQHYNVGSAKSLKLLLPSLAEQHAIAKILSALDEKIELNRRISHTLESVVQTLFESWFVDFSPVIAKSEGRKAHGMNAETAALFPSEFEGSELGMIPKGWHVDTLGNVLSIIKGRSYTSNELQESDTALVSLKSIKRGGGYRTDGLKPFIGKHKPEQVLIPGELVVSCTDITQEADVVGRPAIIPHQNRFKTLVASLDLLILRPVGSVISVPFLHSLLRTNDYVSYIIGRASGTTVLHLSKDGVPSYKFVVPPPSVLLAFNKFAKPIYEKLSTIDIESDNLASIRDTLLPKLLSGEIRVKVT